MPHITKKLRRKMRVLDKAWSNHAPNKKTEGRGDAIVTGIGRCGLTVSMGNATFVLPLARQ